MRERKHREKVWITKATDSLCPQVDTNTDTDDADEMEDVSAAAAAAPTAVDGNSAAAGSRAAATPAASLTPPVCSGRQLRSVSDLTEGPAHRAGTVRSLSFLQRLRGPNNKSGNLMPAVSHPHYKV